MQGMEMKNEQIMMMEKLSFFGILKAALTIPYKNPKFIIFTNLTSLPLFFTMVLYETIFQQTLIEASTSLSQIHLQPYYYYYHNQDWSIETLISLIQSLSHRFLQLGFLYLVPLPLLDLLNAIATVDSASAMYTGEKPRSLKEMFHRTFNKRNTKGPVITSIYVLFMSSLTLLGLIWVVTNYFTTRVVFFTVVYGVCFVVLLAKWLDWSAIWNMGIIISILEERHGVEAMDVSTYFSRGSRRRRFCLMLVFFVWSLALRLPCLYLGWQSKGSGTVLTSVYVSVVCLGNVMKWVVCMVYFHDCKKRILEKKVDVEAAAEVEVANT